MKTKGGLTYEKFYTASDVEYAASRGESRIVINEYDVVTDVAKEAAEKHNIQFVIGSEVPEVTNDIPRETASPSVGSPAGVVSNEKIIAPEYRGLISDQEVETWRQEFPILKDAIHVANCSQSAQARGSEKL